MDGENFQNVLLMKDKKEICRTRCYGFPSEVPSRWIISDFQSSIFYKDSKLPRCQMQPEPENSFQKREWGIFMNFLWKNEKAAIVRLEFYSIYILSPEGGRDFPYAVVLYRTSDNVPTSSETFKPPGVPQCDLNKLTYSKSLLQTQSFIRRSKELNEASNTVNYRLMPDSGAIALQDSACSSGEIVAENLEVNRSAFRLSDVHRNFSNKSKFIGRSNDSSSPDADEFSRNFVKTNPSYLRTLSHNHSGWIFGAMAELVDNSRDANAKRLDIFIENLYFKKAKKKIPILCIIDDGHGMCHDEMVKMLSFGHGQTNKEDMDHIGRFGIGFKTGAMKLGKDALVLTQTSNSRSVALLSQSYNENRENIEIPIITYALEDGHMEFDLSIQSEAVATCNLNAIKEFTPFNEYLIGQKVAQFDECGTGTQIYIWNLDQWGSDYTLQWETEETASNSCQLSQSDILIRSRRVRSRPGQITRQVPLDYSLRAYLEVIFLEPRMKIYVQGSLVKSRPLAKSLNTTKVVEANVMGKCLRLTIGRSKLEFERMNCGVFLYWHGRLIEAYKRVGGMVHNADMGRGVIGVIDVTDLMDCQGEALVLNNKQGFQDSEEYAVLEKWLGERADEYWDTNFDAVELKKGGKNYQPDHEWVQCNKCRKWRILSNGFDTESLPSEWFCYMPPFYGNCEMPEQQLGRGVITIATQRSGYEDDRSLAPLDGGLESKANNAAASKKRAGKRSVLSRKLEKIQEGFWISDAGEATGSLDREETAQKPLKRLRKGPKR